MLKRWSLIAIFGVMLFILVLVMECAKNEPANIIYHCPMHPTYISDKPGNCPICGMKLVPIEKQDGSPTPGGTATPTSAAEQPAQRKILYYRNPMDPKITSPVPMKDSMGMDYIPVYEGGTPVSNLGLKDLAPIVLNQPALELAGVQTAMARKEQISRLIRTVGLVAPDETRVFHIHTKVTGYIEKLYANYTGQIVKAGQPILAIFSPELLASQQEFIHAVQTAKQFESSSIPEVRQGGQELIAASRRRLELFDVPKSLIAQLETTQKAQRTVTLSAVVSGYITTKDVFEGKQVEPGMELYTITDLSRVWIFADIYEYEASRVRLGQKADLIPAYDPTAQVTGKVDFISPTINPDSRTLKVRFQVPNQDMALKPGMYVNAEMQTGAEEGVTIPDSAVLDTGKRQIVFVETEPGRFEPREVRVTNRSAGMAQVATGIAEGEKVVIRANFLIDSESRLRAALTEANPPSASTGQGNSQ